MDLIFMRLLHHNTPRSLIRWWLFYLDLPRTPMGCTDWIRKTVTWYADAETRILRLKERLVMVSVLRVKDADGRPSVGIVLGDSDMFTTSEGDPKSGAALDPEAAREVARRLLQYAAEIEAETGG